MRRCQYYTRGYELARTPNVVFPSIRRNDVLVQQQTGPFQRRRAWIAGRAEICIVLRQPYSSRFVGELAVGRINCFACMRAQTAKWVCTTIVADNCGKP